MTIEPRNHPIDLRSDTVTRPTEAMRRAMAEAAVGDDVYSEDPTIERLERTVAELLGKEAALFVPTGVMSNQLCLKVLTRPGDEVLLGSFSHIFNYETAAPAVLSGVQLHTLDDADGAPDPDDVAAAVREAVYYMPRTAVLALEQTHNRTGGRVIPLERIERFGEVAREHGLAFHLDGARLWNACEATGVEPARYASFFDTVSVCLSKGLGAPVGSVMAASRERVEMARHYRKMWGGGWRQAGILAAAGLHALEHHRAGLVQDHRNARTFYDALQSCSAILLDAPPETNIVVFGVQGGGVEELAQQLARRGVLISAAFKGRLRAVFHRDATGQDALAAAEAIRGALPGAH